MVHVLALLHCPVRAGEISLFVGMLLLVTLGTCVFAGYVAIWAFAGNFKRFSLQGLFILMTLIAYFLGVIVWLRH